MYQEIVVKCLRTFSVQDQLLYQRESVSAKGTRDQTRVTKYQNYMLIWINSFQKSARFSYVNKTQAKSVNQKGQLNNPKKPETQYYPCRKEGHPQQDCHFKHYCRKCGERATSNVYVMTRRLAILDKDQKRAQFLAEDDGNLMSISMDIYKLSENTKEIIRKKSKVKGNHKDGVVQKVRTYSRETINPLGVV